jgi:hypothetical protein
MMQLPRPVHVYHAKWKHWHGFCMVLTISVGAVKLTHRSISGRTVKVDHFCIQVCFALSSLEDSTRVHYVTFWKMKCLLPFSSLSLSHSLTPPLPLSLFWLICVFVAIIIYFFLPFLFSLFSPFSCYFIYLFMACFQYFKTTQYQMR